jgi:glutamine synthetase
VPNFEAPTNICWGFRNRSAMIRVPASANGNGSRIEFRCPDPSSNPYLAFAAVVAAGLDGISRKLKPPEPVNGIDVYKLSQSKKRKLGIKPLPSSLDSARKHMKNNPVIMDAVGRYLMEAP